jgi:phage host-nuclease inhibitor protein Gam
MKRVLETLADVESAMNELQRTDAQLELATATADQQIATIRDGVTGTVAPLEQKQKQLRASIEAWAEEYRNDPEIFPNGAKTIDLQAGSISFRLGAQKVVLRKKTKLADVIERALASVRFKKILSTPSPELDKTAVKDLYEDGKLSDEDMKELGLEITQDESLTIKLKKLDSYAK